MARFTAGAALALSMALAPSAGAQTAASIEGVWRVTGLVVTGPHPVSIPAPQPSIYIFSHGYYADVLDNSPTPRTAAKAFADPAKPTDAERLAKYEEWAPLSAQSGRYEIKGGMLIRHPIVAKNVVALDLDSRPVEIKRLGPDTLVILSRSAPGQPPREQRLTLTRLR